MSNKIKLAKAEPDPGPSVAVAYVHEDRLDYSFFHSFVQLMGYDAANAGRVWRGGFVARRGTTGDLAAARNGGVVDFLAGDADWLWWVDTDMGFDPNTIDRLVAAADPVERPIVGGLCFSQRESEHDGVGGYRPVAWPTIMDWTFEAERGGFQIRWDYPRDALTRVSGTGSACILIHRTVFERVRDAYEGVQREAGVRKDGDPRWDSWYTRVTNPSTGELVGEDLSFCMRLMRVEIPVHVHTGIQTTHRKNVWLSEQDYWRQRALAPAPEEVENLPAEDRTVPRYAVVPTHNRPERLLALVGSLGKQVDHIVVLDNASDPPVDWAQLAPAALPAVVEVIRDSEQPPNLSRFWNVMFDAVAEHAKAAGLDAWDVAVFNDDAIVPAGWYDICSTVLRAHETAAVAHTGSVPIHYHELVNEYPYPRDKRMCPWAFVARGERALRADESMRWWFFDDDFNRQAIDAGGVLAAPGPLVINANAVQSTAGVLAEQAEADRVTFEKKWADR
jgi:glycosyltransferase involved in cell wall biosynthesis